MLFQNPTEVTVTRRVSVLIYFYSHVYFVWFLTISKQERQL